MYVSVSNAGWGLQRCVLIDAGDETVLYVSAPGLDAAELCQALQSEYAGTASDDADHVILSLDWLHRSGAALTDVVGLATASNVVYLFSEDTASTSCLRIRVERRPAPDSYRDAPAKPRLIA